MSFGSGGFGGFGSNNNNQSTFGGFGSNNNNNTSGGFGSNNNSGGIFGSGNNNTGGSLFGNNSSNSAFGSGGGFGTNNTTTSFGSKPFGSTTGGGLFGGGSTSGTTFGGFGSTSNNTSSTFGSGNTGGGLFGGNKPAFGSGTTTNTGSTSLFGGGNTTGGFGSGTTSAFGASTTGGFGSTATNNGTAGTPFQVTTEKDPGSQNNQSQYQTINFQQPYQNFSLEELRVVDYAQGRRFGNQNGQGGAFGQSTGFGGFGANNNTTTSGFGTSNSSGGGLFGSNNNTSSTGFGTGTTSGFGATNNNSSSGGLFGGNKPGALFGATNNTTPASSTGGLFGSTSNTTSGFGSGSTGFGAPSTGGGLFGQNPQTQNKPAFGGFGSAANNSTTGGFGGSTNTFGQSNTGGGGLFGQQNQTTSTPAFGSSTTASTGGGGLFGNTGGAFGQNQQNQPQNQASGGLFGGGGFGQNNQNQQKPGGLFGSSTNNASGGLFGNTQQQQQQQQPQTGSLFGQKPAGGMFGSTTTSQPASGGLFGNSATNTGNTGGGLFGGLNNQNNNQQNSGSLFGASANQPKTGSLFGASASTTTNTGGLFGGLNQSNNNPAPMGGSLFGQSQPQNNQQPMNNSLFGASGNALLQTSMNTNPYGNDALFAGLATPTQSPGPLATPLSSSQKNKKSTILPQHKLNPSQSTRLLTPQGKRNGGYGFSYSTYGSPATGSSQTSPLNGSMFGSGSLSRSLGKSLSTSNLRNSFTPDTSILAPGAFSTTGRSFGSGSLKKLNINRSINSRPNLFEDNSPPKRVSFAGPSSSTTETNGAITNGTTTTAIVLHEEPQETPAEASFATVNGEASNGIPTNGTTTRPEMEQINGESSRPVTTNRNGTPRMSTLPNLHGRVTDPKGGDYYSIPSFDELKRMSRAQLEHIPQFVVGRDKIGKIEFNMGNPVNLSDVPFDKLFGDIVVLENRHATVYGETCTATKPAQGSGLNVPSRITMGNSWPRGALGGGKKDSKHVERLKKVADTEFLEYRAETGEWVFKVPHFSHYGFDYDDDEESSELSPAPETPAQLGTSQMTSTPQEDSTPSAQSSPDDTFDFKRGMRKQANVPGQFGDEAVYEEDEVMDDTQGESFLGERSVGSFDGQQDYEESESESAEDQSMADSVSGPIRTTELGAANSKDSVMPKSILKTSQMLRPVMGTPSKGPAVFDDDWANTLQRTVSPRKQDRQALRQSQGEVLRERDGMSKSLVQSVSGRNTNANSMMDRMNLMESLFGGTSQPKSSVVKRAVQGIQYPYAKRPKTSHDLNQLTGSDKDFHRCNKPHFSETGILVYAGKSTNASDPDIYSCPREALVGAQKDICFKKLPTFTDAISPTLDLQKQNTRVSHVDNAPRAKMIVEPVSVEFSNFADVVPLDTATGTHEHLTWQLLNLLFDHGDRKPQGMNEEEFNRLQNRKRKEELSAFWQALVYDDAQQHLKQAATPEEKAIAHLSCNSIADACHVLLEGLDLRLATMIAQIGGDAAMRRDMTSQIEEWRRLDVLAEMDESIRALYELISGNCALSEGKIGAGRENRASSFKIGSHFKLDWRRAFGLRLWYGTMHDEPIELAVAQFADALRDGKEDVKPVPWFIEQKLDMGWNDPEKECREDVLWGILKLYASSKLDLPANIEEVLAPENVSGHPLNARLSFLLFQVFKSRWDDPDEDEERIVPMPTIRDSDDARSSFLSSTASTAESDIQAEEPLIELGDKLTLTYAASLHTPEHWTTAVWAYTHLSNSTMRAHYIRSLLNQFSHTYNLAESDTTFKYLAGPLQVPLTWMHAAAALEAKIKGDVLHQATHLIKASELEEAHEVLCRKVGPNSVISRDYDALRELLGGFLGTPPSSPTSELSHASHAFSKKKEPVPGWSQGGQIYFDYVELLDLTHQRVAYRDDEDLNEQINHLLLELQRALEAVKKDKWESVGLEERVALTEIAGTVADLTAKHKMADRARALKLPLAEDLWLRHSIDLSTSYYRNLVS